MIFRETVSPVEVIRSILGSYPFSDGIFREFLQNSDDAAATEQIFILDRRTHPATELLDDRLGSVQGPAVLTFNNAHFTDADWKGIQSIHLSSKTVDTSKIGKYGLGFRSCYHITDCPQIFSGREIAILDPLNTFTENGGIKEDFTTTKFNIGGHIEAFSSSMVPLISSSSEYGGTIFLFPLRASTSGLSKDLISADEIRNLLDNFITAEIDICLLFLNHIKNIKIYEILENGESTLLASRIKAPVLRLPVETGTFDSTLVTSKFYQVSITDQADIMRKWHILEAFYEQSLAITKLSSKSGCQNCEDIIQKHKLMPNVSLAYPIDTDSKCMEGELFTFLPLPIPTEFPVHIHSLFALTSSRQNLRNPTDSGIVRGSTDHIMIEWNKVLFDVFIPHAWSLLMNNLVKQERPFNIFDAFPSKQSHISAGDALYWQELPTKFVQIASSLKIWPTIEAVPQFYCLSGSDSDLLVAVPNENSDILNLLGSINVAVMSPPKDVWNILEDSGIDYKRLIPSILPGPNHLRGEMLVSLNDSQAAVLLEYLLSDQDLLNISNLPLIPSCDGSRLSLQKKDGAMVPHTLLSPEEFSLFGDLDPNGVKLQAMDQTISNLLQREGPGILNISLLGPDRVLSYLIARLQGALDPIAWLSKFWIWLSTWGFGLDVLHALRRDLSVTPIPSSNGLCNLQQPIFFPCGEFQVILSQFGVRFPHPEVSSAVVPSLASFKILRSIEDLADLVDAMSVPNEALAVPDAQKVLHHLQQQPKSAKLNDQLLGKLRSFPIFPILLPHEGKASSPDSYISWGSIPSHQWIVATSYDGPLPASQLVCLQLSKLRPLAVSNDLGLGIKSGRSKTEMTQFAIRSLPNQNASWQLSLLQYLKDSRDVLGLGIYTKLAQTEFVPARDGTIQAPQNLVDPTCDVANILLPNENSHYLATMQGETQTLIISTLTEMQVLSRNMKQSFIQESIMYASMAERNANSRSSMSRAIIKVLVLSGWDCSGLIECFDAEWLPTSMGLKRPTECRDHHDRKLFDLILPVLDSDLKVSVPSSLRAALGWNEPIPFFIICEQLREILEISTISNSIRQDYLITLIDEIIRRNISDLEISSLQSIVRDKEWIPVGRGNLAFTDDVVFSSSDPSIGFYQASNDRHGWEQFLRRMGCSERPLQTRIIQKLNILQDTESLSEGILSQIIRLLGLLPPLPPDSEERKQIPIPLQDGTFDFLASVHYDDVMGISPPNIPVAHQAISMQLADRLGMARTGLLGILDAPWMSTLELGEKPVTTIRTVLRQYVQEQIFTEFIANASDAKASRFSILLDEITLASGNNLVSSQLSLFDGPSLILHNDAKFTMQDFQGICKTGIGGKVGRMDTIGQFGLGALAMFHFTEVAIIISGEYVLFINPSGIFLPEGRNVLLMSLSTVKRNYDSHIQRLRGLFNFNTSPLKATYDGTIFLLPLRTHAQVEYAGAHTPTRFTEAETKVVSEAIPSRQDVIEVLSKFRPDNYKCCIFTGIESISAYRRTQAIYPPSLLWDIHAEMQTLSEEGPFTARLVTFSGKDFHDWDTWLVATGITANTANFVADDTLPAVRCRHDTIKVEMAVELGASAASGSQSHNVFSTLPLPITTTLSLHLSAPFILAPDRHNIRFDEYNNPQTLFNKWILEKGTNSLYYFLLQQVIKSGYGNGELWPCKKVRQEPDVISRLVIKGFYECITTTPYNILQDHHYPSETLPPKKAVFMTPETPSDVQQFLKSLRIRGIVSTSEEVAAHIQEIGLTRMDPSFVRREIEKHQISNSTRLLEGLRKRSPILQAVIKYLIRDSVADIYGLRLIPLQDGSWGRFGNPQSAQMYYLWDKAKKSDTLPLNRIVSFTLAPTVPIKKDLNVAPLDSNGIVELLRSFLPGMQLSADYPAWLTAFWNEDSIHTLIDKSCIAALSLFALVPTSNNHSQISFGACARASTAIIRSELGTPPLDALEALGMTVVLANNLPIHLRKVLSEKEYPNIDLVKILTYLQSTGNFSRLNSIQHYQFAKWCQTKFYTLPGRLRNAFLHLPIWSAAHLGHAPQLYSLSEITVLPNGISLSRASRFVDYLVGEYDINLIKLKKPQTFKEFLSKINLPVILPQEKEEDYLEILKVCLMSTPWPSVECNVQVPNGNRQLVPCTTLYRHCQPFRSIFANNNLTFLLPSFRCLEGKLVHFGLRDEHSLVQRDLLAFIECADAIGDAQDARKISGALRLCSVYGNDLPLHLRLEESLWRKLDNLQFIPRNIIRWPSNPSFEKMPFCDDLPVFVAPSEIALPRNEAICWTQRAFPDLQCGVVFDQVLPAYPSFGQPTVTEVVQHLHVLALEIAPQYPGNAAVLNCLTKTYKWLNTHVKEAGPIIKELNEPVFLNLDDPSTESWDSGWLDAYHILIDSHDVRHLKAPRKYLRPFEELLQGAGAVVIKHIDVSVLENHSHNSDPENSPPQSFFASFLAMREKGDLVDVFFLPTLVEENVDLSDVAVYAHRSFLAAASEHFQHSFLGGTVESSKLASVENPVQIEVPTTPESLKAVIDYLYTDQLPVFISETSPDPEEYVNILLDMLVLADFWNLSGLMKNIEKRIAMPPKDILFITHFNVKKIQRRAQLSNAFLLVAACDQFQLQNEMLMTEVNAEEVEENRGDSSLDSDWDV